MAAVGSEPSHNRGGQDQRSPRVRRTSLRAPKPVVLHLIDEIAMIERPRNAQQRCRRHGGEHSAIVPDETARVELSRMLVRLRPWRSSGPFVVAGLTLQHGHVLEDVHNQTEWLLTTRADQSCLVNLGHESTCRHARSMRLRSGVTQT